MLLWQPVLAEMGTYVDVCTKWDLDDLVDALELIEYKKQLEEYHRKQAQPKRR